MRVELGSLHLLRRIRQEHPLEVRLHHGVLPGPQRGQLLPVQLSMLHVRAKQRRVSNLQREPGEPAQLHVSAVHGGVQSVKVFF